VCDAAEDAQPSTITAIRLLLADAPAVEPKSLLPGSAEALDRLRRLVAGGAKVQRRFDGIIRKKRLIPIS
jgi:hypothetical protein